MKISKRLFGGYKITFEKSESLLLERYCKELNAPGVYCVAHLLGHLLSQQVDFVLETLAAAGIMLHLIPDKFLSTKKES